MHDHYVIIYLLSCLHMPPSASIKWPSNAVIAYAVCICGVSSVRLRTYRPIYRLYISNRLLASQIAHDRHVHVSGHSVHACDICSSSNLPHDALHHTSSTCTCTYIHTQCFWNCSKPIINSRVHAQWRVTVVVESVCLAVWLSGCSQKWQVLWRQNIVYG